MIKRAATRATRWCRAWLSDSLPGARRALAFVRLHRRKIRWGAFFLFHAAGLISSVDAVMHTRTSQGAIAWAISLNTFPYVAVPAYWVFGHPDFEGYADARVRIAAAEREARTDLPELGEEHPLVMADPPVDLHTLEQIARMPSVSGNEVELLVDGEAIMGAICEAIDAASDYVLVQFYIMRDDETGLALADCLARAVARGVSVRLLYDSYGSLKTPDGYFGTMRDAGVDVRPFRAAREGPVDFEVNYRNHRKLVVIDGRAAFVGGMNIGDEYLSKDPEIGYWRDTHLRVVGAAVPYFQAHFATDWHWASGESLQDLQWQPQRAPGLSAGEEGVRVLAIGTGPDDTLERCSLMFQAAIHAADERLWIATPYFAPDEAVTAALTLAAMRGVDVRILIPEHGDSFSAHYASYSYVPEMEDAGVKIHRYRKGILHQKVLLADSRLGFVGSANFDNRSFRLNFELVVAVWDDARLLGEIESMLEADFAESFVEPAEKIEEAPFHVRLASRFFRMLAPIY